MVQSLNSHEPPWLQLSLKEDAAGAEHGMGGSQDPTRNPLPLKTSFCFLWIYSVTGDRQ